MKLEIIFEDITKLKVDVIVNAANSSLMGGGGVDGAIHRVAGPQLLEECKKIRRSYPEGLPTGQAVLTKGYNLPAKYVIHTVGPIYDKDSHPKISLENCYKNSLNLAEENNLKSIAFPAISTGIYGYPKEKALRVVNKVLSNYEFKALEKVILCFFSENDKDMAEKIINHHIK